MGEVVRRYRATSNPHIVQIQVPRSEMSSDKTYNDIVMAEPLSVAKTIDEFGQERFFVQTYLGDWVGEPYDTHDLADDAIKRLRGES